MRKKEPIKSNHFYFMRMKEWCERVERISKREKKKLWKKREEKRRGKTENSSSLAKESWNEVHRISSTLKNWEIIRFKGRLVGRVCGKKVKMKIKIKGEKFFAAFFAAPRLWFRYSSTYSKSLSTNKFLIYWPISGDAGISTSMVVWNFCTQMLRRFGYFGNGYDDWQKTFEFWYLVSVDCVNIFS